MSSESTANHPVAHGEIPPLSPEQRVRLLEELQVILESESFAGSKRGRQFLSYIVEHSLDGHSERLKERSIGVDLFGRPASYDTGEDSVVRVTAGDVRQRLKRYQQEHGGKKTVHINLPLGSYAPEYDFPSGLDVHLPRRRVWIGLAVLLAVGLSVATGFYLSQSWTSPLNRFWRPLKKSSSPVLECIATLDESSYPWISDRAGPGRKVGDVVHIDEIIRLSAAHPIHMSAAHPVDASVAVDLASFLGSIGKTSRMRNSTSTSFDDLRGSPAVMIGGAFSNQWTMQRTNELHFIYVHNAANVWMIQEQTAPGRHWEIPDALVVARTEPVDYGLVSRIFDRETGQVLVAFGGLTHNGTRAAAECIMSAACLGAAVKDAPRDWERRNMQFVVRAKVVSDTPAAPEVIASYFW